jgi:hypothetical protein
MKNFILNWNFIALALLMCVIVMLVQFPKTQQASNSEIPSGTYRQLTKSKSHLSDLYYDPVYFKRGKVPGEKRWFVDPLDEIDPAYKFYFDKRSLGQEKGDGVLVGQLISPTGNVYDLQQIDYENSTRILTFSSRKRGHVTYDGNIQFSDYKFAIGVVKLKASGDFGTVEIEFEISAWALE